MNSAIKYVHTLVKTKTDQKKNSVQHQSEQKSFPCNLIYANFNIEKIQLSGKSKPELDWFCFTSLSDWLRKFTSVSQPIRRKTKTIVIGSTNDPLIDITCLLDIVLIL